VLIDEIVVLLFQAFDLTVLIEFGKSDLVSLLVQFNLAFNIGFEHFKLDIFVYDL